MLKMTRNIIQHAPKPSGKRWQQSPAAQSTCPSSPCLPQAQKPRSSLFSPFVQDQKLAELNSLPYPHSYYSSGSAVVKCWIKCVLSNCSTLESEQIIHITVEQVVSHNIAGFCLSPSVFPDAAWALWYMHTPAWMTKKEKEFQSIRHGIQPMSCRHATYHVTTLHLTTTLRGNVTLFQNIFSRQKNSLQLFINVLTMSDNCIPSVLDWRNWTNEILVLILIKCFALVEDQSTFLHKWELMKIHMQFQNMSLKYSTRYSTCL